MNPITAPINLSDSISVGMGQIAVCKGNGLLRTLLGSCVGVALMDRRLKVCGLAHIVMPDSLSRTDQLGKYADTAIPETLRQMSVLVSNQKLSCTARIAGGANMFALSSKASISQIGDMNVATVERILASLGITILAREIGGTQGRRMFFDVSTGTIRIESVGSPSVQL